MQTHHYTNDCGNLLKREVPYQEPCEEEEEKSSLAEKVLNGRGDSLEKYRLYHNNNQQTAGDAKSAEHHMVTPIYSHRQTAISS
jgi:hypothetical protein